MRVSRGEKGKEGERVGDVKESGQDPIIHPQNKGEDLKTCGMDRHDRVATWRRERRARPSFTGSRSGSGMKH